MKKTLPFLAKGIFSSGIALIFALMLSACGTGTSDPRTDLSLVANPREESPIAEEETPSDTPLATAPTASASAAVPLRQMLLPLEQISTDTAQQDILNAMAKVRENSDSFPDYSLLFRQLDPESRLSVMLLADDYVYQNRRPAQTMPLSGSAGDVYYDAAAEDYHIPARTLTEDELFMLLDWEMQANCIHLNNSLSRIPEAYDLKSEQALVGQAVRLIQGTYNAEIGDFEYYLRNYKRGEDMIWQLNFFRPNANSLSYEGHPCEWYCVELFAPSGEFYQMKRGFTDCLAEAELPQTSANPLNVSDFTLDALRQDSYWVQDAREILEEVIQTPSSIQEIYLHRFDGDDQMILRAAMEDQSSYRFIYSLISRLPNEIKYLTAEELPIALDPLVYPPETDPLSQETVDENSDGTASTNESVAPVNNMAEDRQEEPTESNEQQ